MGLYNHHKTLDPSRPQDPLVPCSDMCGTVVAVGAGPHTITWNVGDRVLSTFVQTHLTGQIKAPDMAHGMGKPLEGVLQTYRVFPSYGLVRAPEYLSDEEASCLPIAAVTAWMAINGMRPMGDDIATAASKKEEGTKEETVLLQGTGGVSISGLQIAKASGAKGEYPICCLFSCVCFGCPLFSSVQFSHVGGKGAFSCHPRSPTDDGPPFIHLSSQPQLHTTPRDTNRPYPQ